jgi:zinc protease
MSIQTQAGLAGFLGSLAVSGQPIEYLREFPAAVDALTEDEVIEASREYLDPRKLDTVLVGDAATIGSGVEALDEVELVEG